MFLVMKNVYFTNYVDDNIPFVVRDQTKDVIKTHQEIDETLMKWFLNEQMKLNIKLSFF